MKKSRYSESPIIQILNESESDLTTKKLYQKYESVL